MTHTAGDIVSALHAIGRDDLSRALTLERLAMVRTLAELAEHRRQLFEALELVIRQPVTHIDCEHWERLLDELRPHVAKEGALGE